ncbi:MAG: prepilin-type N-terminal cleavage/methylation domain-containing protein [Candidatus Omnitrophica bacterium]|nr:prepilin-type N-terminal cleavage/methylation domain-containing protein [Candidatus Omnitrophota bacterium]
MKKRAFTLVEIIVTVVIVGILATIGLPVYQNVLESSKQKVCDTNLLTLKKAVELYTMEHDIVPGALSQLNDKYIRKAYAEVMSGKGAWGRRLAYLIVEGPQWGLAYADTYGMPKLRCPCNADPTKPSYGINSGVAGTTSLEYKNLADNAVIVADSGGEVFTYAGGGGSGNKSDHAFIAVPLITTMQKNPHKKFKPLGPPEYFLRGITKDEHKGTFNSSGMFYPE